jgi:hypothetical protein
MKRGLGKSVPRAAEGAAAVDSGLVAGAAGALAEVETAVEIVADARVAVADVVVIAAAAVAAGAGKYLTCFREDFTNFVREAGLNGSPFAFRLESLSQPSPCPCRPDGIHDTIVVVPAYLRHLSRVPAFIMRGFRSAFRADLRVGASLS